ncbi:MAG: 50S ribosomal protein L18 [Alphaproteobacteria bacterium]
MKTPQIKRRIRGVRVSHTVKTAAARTERYRLTVFRSNSHMYAQIIDDTAGKTLVSASTVDKKIRKSLKSTTSTAAAQSVGAELAKRAKTAGVEAVYFDRGGFRYMGRIKALADAARENGLNF